MKPVLVNRRVQVAVGVFLTLIISVSAGRLQAQSESIRFTHLTVEDGLSQNSVQSILQDRDGFMWFGTQHGLNKYDGYNLTTYYQNPADTFALAEDGVSVMYEDRQGNLWFLTYRQLYELKRQNKSADKFTSYNIQGETICEDDSGLYWVGLPYGFLHFDPWQNKIIQRLDYPQVFHVSSNVLQDRGGAIWFGTMNGEILQLSRGNDGRWSFTQYRHSPATLSRLPSCRITSIQFANDGAEKVLWMGMNGGGLCRMRLADDRVLACEHFFHDPANPRSLSSNFVQSILFDKTGALWVGANGGGLCKLIWNEKSRAEFIRYQNNPVDPASLSDNDVCTLYQDRSGMIWVGTAGGGVNKFDPQQSELRHYRHDSSHPAGLPSNTIWTFYEDRVPQSGILWIGADSSLIKFTRHLDQAKETFTRFPLPPAFSPGISSSQVRAIWEDRAGMLWIGTLGCGLGKFDRATEKFVFDRHDSTDSNNPGNIYALYGDSSGALWIGMNSAQSAGFAKVWQDQQHGPRFKNYFRYGNNAQEKLEWVVTIHPFRASGDLWLGLWDKGLIRFDPKLETFNRYSTLPQITVLSIYEDSTGAVWLGTYGGGLKKFDPKSGIVTPYTVRDGLADNVIYSILPDDFGNLWLSTDKGISKFNPRTKRFQNFDVNDGLQSNEFNLGAALRTRNGELYFGGNNGFNRFRPAELNTAPPEIMLTAFKKRGKDVVFDKPLAELKTITLSHQENFFAFEFAAVDYKNPAKNRYAYKMEGFDQDWIHLGNKHDASYTNLDPGEYTFRVKAANSDGMWNEQGLAIQVKITPPYWRTWWFALLTLVVAAGAVMALYRYRVQQKLAIERVRFRERETMQKKIARNVHDDFTSQLTQITVATGIAKQQTPELPAQTLEALSKIAAHAAELSRQMKDFIWNLDPEKDTLYHLAEQWKNFSDTLFEYTDIAFQLAGLTPEFDAVQLPVEWKQHLYLIFKEAMHNVLKHAANCKNVTLAIAFQDGSLQISLTNDGLGFDATNGRRGNGLQNMRYRAQELGGTLEILSEETGGTTVRFSGKLPERPVAPKNKFAILKEELKRRMKTKSQNY